MKREQFIKYSKISVLLLLIVLVQACSSTKFVPEGEYLLNDVSVEIDSREVSREELKNQVRQSGNMKILGFLKFHLGMYNLSSKKKSNDWLKRIGEAPVVYEDFQTLRSLEQLNIYLENKGFYDAEISDTLIYHPKKNKVNLEFSIKAGEPYRIRNYNYQFEDKEISNDVLSVANEQLIGAGDIFDVDVLDEERDRISTVLNNRGYYYFSKDYIQFSADTTLNSKQVDLTVEISDSDLENEVDSVVRHKKYVVRNYQIIPDFEPMSSLNRNQNTLEVDTLFEPPYTFIYKDKLKYRPELFENLNRVKDSTNYSLANVEKTFRSINQLQQFKVINLNFEPVDFLGNDSIGVLDAIFQLSPMERQGFSVEVEGTNSSGNLGVAGNLNYQHKNIFRGAEIFDITFTGGIERQQALVENNSLSFNTQELGVEVTLTFPEFLSPFESRGIYNFQVPQTTMSLGYNYQHRPDYTRTITNLSFGYNWKSSSYKTHYFNLVDFYYVNLYQFNDVFISSIQDLYIKSSFTDHLISALSYTYVENTQSLSRKENYHYFKWSVESAGNVFAALSGITNMKEVSEVDSITGVKTSYNQLFGTRFAQYLESDLEYRYGYMIDNYNALVGRAYLGVGVPYGNFDVLPYEKKYFTGGANGIRAWQVRTLGPGTYKADSGDYPNQFGDIKLEANLEYRFRLAGMVEGALFLDAGNIWAINNKDNREGSVFHFDKFYKQIAVGTGAGLRFDFTYFLFRLDLGMKLRDPSLEEGKRFIPGNYPIKGEHFNLSFAIGYPF